VPRAGTGGTSRQSAYFLAALPLCGVQELVE
jgi:hypothetical protein